MIARMPSLARGSTIESATGIGLCGTSGTRRATGAGWAWPSTGFAIGCSWPVRRPRTLHSRRPTNRNTIARRMISTTGPPKLAATVHREVSFMFQMPLVGGADQAGQMRAIALPSCGC
jgi:hypothetical protein